MNKEYGPISTTDTLVCRLLWFIIKFKNEMVKKLRALNIWSLIGLLIIGIAIISSITKGLNSEKVFIGILGLALLFNLFDW